MTFEESLDQAIAMLQRCGRVTYRALKQQFQLDDATLEDLKHELIEGQRLAVDEQGDVLVWTGGVPLLPVPVPAPSPSAPSFAPLGVRPAPRNVPSMAPLTADAERRQLTVLFCDLVGSTLLAEQLDPEDLREVVRAYQQASAAIIARYNGYIAQYQGDGLLVYFGFPQAHEDDAQRAGHTALGIVAMLDDLNGQLEPIHGVRIAVRIGIHTGPVVVGTLGDETRQEPLALGETPAIAAGIQGLAPPDSVVVSAATAHLLQDVFIYEALGTHLVNDVTDPLAVLHVLASRTAELSPATVVPPERADEGDEAERRQLTVMFCTLADPARLAIQLTSAHLLTVVQGYQQACAAVVQYYDGYIAQYLENGVLVYFGFPHAHEDDAQRAVRTGLEIVDAMPALNAHLTPQYGVRVAARIGIHTGRVVAGPVGGGTRTEQLAVGPTPNVAARIHGLATPDTVMISATTLRLVHGYFVCEDRGTHLLKGVADPMPVARVLAPTTAQSRLEAVGPGEGSPLVGRDMELAVCVDRWVQSTAGQGQVVMLWGEAAIGKSRLVEALYTHIHREDGRRITFRCLPYHTHSAFYPLITHLERRLQFTRDEPIEAKVTKLEQWLKTYRFPQPETLPLIAALLSVPLPEGYSPPLPLGLQQQRQRTQATLVAWLMEEAERQPLLAVWEDLHWMDPSTLEVLGLLIDHTATGRMLTVLTARPEFQPSWEPRDSLTVLTLRRLERVHVEAIVHGVTRGKALPAAILAQIVEKTDGVPLFVEELTKAIVESGIVRAVNGHYELTALAGTIEIPLTLQDSLMARLDRLGAAKRVAQVGAVIGREFSPELLEAVTPHDRGTVQRLVDQLVAAELLFPHESPQATYVFKHALIRDAAYQSLLRRTRQQYHQRIAQVLSARFPETVETQPEVLAHHFTEAGLSAQALSYWQRAGERATQRSAHMEAVNHLTKGLEILRTLPPTPEHTQQELMLQVALGAPLMATKGWAAPEVEQVCGRARAVSASRRVCSALPSIVGPLEFLYCTGTVAGGAGVGGAISAARPKYPRLCLPPAGPLYGGRYVLLVWRVSPGESPPRAGYRPRQSPEALLPCCFVRARSRDSLSISCGMDFLGAWLPRASP